MAVRVLCALALSARAAAAPAAAPASGQAAGAWAQTGLAPHIARVPPALGWPEPTEIQRRCIAPILAGRDVVGQASTGSGKTAAYALPLVERAAAEPLTPPSARPLCVVVVPTRELCVQVAAAIKAIASEAALGDVRVGTVYGGTSRSAEAAGLADPPHVLVATPGRLLDHLDAAHLAVPPGGVRTLVLDEADRLFELGFFDAAAGIVDACAPAQLALFSATMPAPVLELIDAEMRAPYRALLAAEGGHAAEMPATVRLIGVRCALDASDAADVAQLMDGDEAAGAHERAAERARLRALRAILSELSAPAGGTPAPGAPAGASALVFCNTRASAMRAWRGLAGAGAGAGRGARPVGGRLEVALLSGELEQRERETSLFLLRQRAVHALVATDLGARGLDVAQLDAVVHFELPPAWDRVTFVHRAGRTGRADLPGKCFSLCASADDERVLSAWADELGGRELAWRDADAPGATHAPCAADGPGALAPPAWSVVRIGAGKREKLSRGDVLGAVTALTRVRGDEVGLIEVYADFSLVGLPRHAAEDAVVALRAGRIKRERRLVSIVRPERVSLRADQARRPGTVPPPRRDERRER
ncbi:hypothetical protein KFE25_009437 [Diacronema lutheri]|uniref:RNA helicase n=1 Tax=Diacronema lutheri TaxID=2081491 RepID=A0A8J5XXT8_DIALT|nr:hypothetical protein KFE25_009437 [Diacronema lutheri]